MCAWCAKPDKWSLVYTYVNVSYHAVLSLLMQIKQSQTLTRKWAEDHEVQNCMSCGKGFSVTIRKVTILFKFLFLFLAPSPPLPPTDSQACLMEPSDQNIKALNQYYVNGLLQGPTFRQAAFKVHHLFVLGFFSPSPLWTDSIVQQHFYLLQHISRESTVVVFAAVKCW